MAKWWQGLALTMLSGTLAACGGAASQVAQGGHAAKKQLRMQRVELRVQTELPQPTSGLVAVPWQGRILALGGLVNDISSSQDIAIQGTRATPMQSLPAGLHDFAAVAQGGSILLLGGGTNGGTGFTASCLRWSPGSGAGRLLPSLPAAFSDQAAAVVGGHVLLVGGYDGSNVSNIVYELTPSGWQANGRLPQGLRYAALAVDGKDLYIAGGLTASGQFSDAIYRWHSGAVKQVATLPVRLRQAVAFVSGGYLYVLGGETGTGGYTNAIYAWPVRGGRLVRDGSLPMAMGYGSLASMGNGQWLLVGGSTAAGDISRVFRVTLRP